MSEDRGAEIQAGGQLINALATEAADEMMDAAKEAGLLAEAPAEEEYSLGDIIKALNEIREERRAIAARDKDLIKEWQKWELRMFIAADEQGMKQFASDVATATITVEVLPKVSDWQEVYKYIQENEAWHLLQKRISSASYRELQDAGIEIPGVEAYNKRKVALRAANK
jgi:hypothetical protein